MLLRLSVPGKPHILLSKLAEMPQVCLVAEKP
jgi:hypothetical protein